MVSVESAFLYLEGLIEMEREDKDEMVVDEKEPARMRFIADRCRFDLHSSSFKFLRIDILSSQQNNSLLIQ